MPQPQRFEVLVLGSGTGGKLLAWHLAGSGHKTAVVERRWIGGSCPNIACMPSKNEISSAKVADVARHGGDHGTVTGSVIVDMAMVRRRKREMVERQVAKHLQIYGASGAELIMGSGRFVAPKILEVNLNDGAPVNWRPIRFSLTSERMRQFQTFLVCKRPNRLRISRLWSSIICHNT
jgi:pyruvate/2-oxoglutarate dehydrogenase complex dihydrolipoamide dehydrogenase (E3) component